MRLEFIGTVTSSRVLYQSLNMKMSMGTLVQSLAEKN
jgi:hypothetical protein